MNVRRRGGRVVVINPVKEVGLVNFRVPSDLWSLLFGTRIASLYVQPHIGGDIALLTGVAKVVLERDGADRRFIDAATEGFAEYERQVRAVPWDEIVRRSGVETSQIAKIADLYLSARSAVFGWTMGITQHEHGVANVQSIVNLALLRGMAGRPRAGLLPIRGHSNVQGVGSMGVAPNLKQSVLDNLEKHLGVTLPRSPGLDTMGCMKAAERGEMRAAFCLGGNLFGSNPDAAFAARALSKLDQVTYLSTTLNTGHVHGRGAETLILPVRARDEEPEPTTQESMFNYVRLSDGGPARVEGARSEIDLVASLGKLVLPTAPVEWEALRRACDVRQMIAKIIPGFQQLGDIDRTRGEFQIPGRTFHAPRFATPSGRARFTVHELPALRGEGDQLRLMTVRSEGQFNTVVYEEEDIYRGQDRRNVILMNRADIRRLGLRADQPVTVRSAAGSLCGILVRPFDVRAGNAVMYFPEANTLVPATTDPASKTPAFKSVLVTVEPTRPETATSAPGRIALEVVHGS
jgi:molybdopterin-dependent oxidoreductase alpha subunit